MASATIPCFQVSEAGIVYPTYLPGPCGSCDCYGMFSHYVHITFYFPNVVSMYIG